MSSGREVGGEGNQGTEKKKTSLLKAIRLDSPEVEKLAINKDLFASQYGLFRTGERRV